MELHVKYAGNGTYVIHSAIYRGYVKQEGDAYYAYDANLEVLSVRPDFDDAIEDIKDTFE